MCPGALLPEKCLEITDGKERINFFSLLLLLFVYFWFCFVCFLKLNCLHLDPGFYIFFPSYIPSLWPAERNDRVAW